MSKDAARKILDTVVRHLAEQNAVLIEIENLCSADEFSRYKRMIGQSMGAIVVDVMDPILGGFPDLMPPHLKQD